MGTVSFPGVKRPGRGADHYKNMYCLRDLSIFFFFSRARPHNRPGKHRSLRLIVPICQYRLMITFPFRLAMRCGYEMTVSLTAELTEHWLLYSGSAETSCLLTGHAVSKG
jgi:hypothetical protein